MLPYFEGISTRNYTEYEISQIQRKIEREIRSAKREREQNYGRVSYPKSLTSVSNNGKMKMDNISVRKWYHNHIHNIPNEIEQSLSIEEKAKSASELRNKYRIMAREMMADIETRKKLDKKRPNKTFEELLTDKMKRKNMTREEAIQDIYDTAVKSNPDVDKELGL